MSMRLLPWLLFIGVLISPVAHAQTATDTPESTPPTPQLKPLVDQVQAERIQSDVQAMVDFGTRHTLSDTTSDTRGIGAARRWVHDTFESISEDCGGCLEVFYQKDTIEAGVTERIPEDTEVYNVMAIQRGTLYPDRYVLMGGHLDSRVSDIMDTESDAPGANDAASGVAGSIEAARVLSQHEFASSIVYVGFTGEEQGLFGAQIAAEKANENDWELFGVLNNDMIGNVEGISGATDNTTFRIFSQVRPDSLNDDTWSTRFFGGENDGPSRQLARYVARMADLHVDNLDPELIYRLDRFGRGGDHRAFNDEGFPSVRVMEYLENYNRQHQDLRTEDGIEYGDTIDGIDFTYAAKITGVNVASLASLASAPPAPSEVAIGGAVQPSTTLSWTPHEDTENVEGYVVYWRPTSAARWTNRRYVGNVTEHTLENIMIDNHFFGVAAIGPEGHESPVVFPQRMMR